MQLEYSPFLINIGQYFEPYYIEIQMEEEIKVTFCFLFAIHTYYIII